MKDSPLQNEAPLYIRLAFKLYQSSFKMRMLQSLNRNMEVDNNSEKVAILDAGAQYGKVRLTIANFMDNYSLVLMLESL